MHFATLFLKINASCLLCCSFTSRFVENVSQNCPALPKLSHLQVFVAVLLFSPVVWCPSSLSWSLQNNDIRANIQQQLFKLHVLEYGFLAAFFGHMKPVPWFLLDIVHELVLVGLTEFDAALESISFIAYFGWFKQCYDWWIKQPRVGWFKPSSWWT
jgi:hypothetical protein